MTFNPKPVVPPGKSHRRRKLINEAVCQRCGSPYLDLIPSEPDTVGFHCRACGFSFSEAVR